MFRAIIILMRLKARRDGTEDPIIEGLEKAGYSVVKISQANVPDLLVCKDGRAWFVECKSKYGTLRDGQAKFIEQWQGCPIIVAKTLEEVLSVIA